MRLKKLYEDKKKKAFKRVSAKVEEPKSKKNKEQDRKKEQDATDRSWELMQNLQYSMPDRGPNTDLEGQLDRAH